MIQELIQQLVQKVGISEEQATKAATVAHEFIKSKLPPQMATTVDGFFNGASAGTAGAEAKAENWTDKAKDMAHDAGDKIADFASKAKDKAEDFAEDAGKKIGEWAEKAEDIAEDAIDKIKDMFKGRKDNDGTTAK